MSVIRMPRFLGGPDRRAPSPDWDKETTAMCRIGEWLAGLDGDEAKLRVLTYWMWRLKSNAAPERIEEWVDSIAEQSAIQVAKRHGFGGSAE